MNRNPVAVVLFDFGGVLAEEGFTEGLKAIATRQGLVPDDFFHRATEIIYQCGYVTGRNSEAGFWQQVGKECGIAGSASELTGEILRRFVLRPGMLDLAGHLRESGVRTGILSDQTDWLEQLDRQGGFLAGFDPVLNSYHLGYTKRDPETFVKAARRVGVDPGRILFVDDNPGHIGRAAAMGLQVHHFLDEASFRADLAARGLSPSPREGAL